MTTIDAKGVYYKQLNEQIKAAAAGGEKHIKLINVCGQYYIADGITSDVTIEVEGVPGQDLAAFMNGPTIIVKNNAQDTIGNTMDAGKVIVHGLAGDVLGYGMRGGRMHVLNDVGYRVGIHMKSYKEKIPVIVVGGKAGDFFGEYMAGGVLILLGMFSMRGDEVPTVGDYLGTGMHGGVMYIRGRVDLNKCGKEVGLDKLDKTDKKLLERHLEEYCKDFKLDIKEILKEEFTKVYPKSKRPYGTLYCY
jgi:glutamate synthase domain-containing protein 3